MSTFMLIMAFSCPAILAIGAILMVVRQWRQVKQWRQIRTGQESQHDP